MNKEPKKHVNNTIAESIPKFKWPSVHPHERGDHCRHPIGPTFLSAGTKIESEARKATLAWALVSASMFRVARQQWDRGMPVSAISGEENRPNGLTNYPPVTPLVAVLLVGGSLYRYHHHGAGFPRHYAWSRMG